MGTSRKRKKPSSKKNARTVLPKVKKGQAPAAGPAAQGSIYILLTGMVLVAAGLFSFPNFRVWLPPGGFLSNLLVHPSLALVGFAILIFAFRQLPDEGRAPDISKPMAYVCFAFFFGLCAFWRFYRPLEPSAHHWFDNQVVTGDIANILDSGYHPLLFPFGQREAFFPYLTAFLWYFFPDANGAWMTRLSSTVIDLLAIWGLYLLGSTLRGRSMGLGLMALWAVSLPMTVWSYFEMGVVTATLAAIWALFFFYRLVQKPTLARFLYWGASLGFGGYCYVPFRPWTPTLITLVLVWILFGSKEKPRGGPAWFLAGGLWLSWTLLFLNKNNFLPTGGALISLITHPLFLFALLAALLAAFAKLWTDKKKNETDRRIMGWATGATLTALLMAPLYLHPGYAQHTSQSSAFYGENGPIGLSEGLQVVWHNVLFFVQAMFWQTHFDIGFYPLPGQSFYEPFTELFMVAALAYFIARPDWRKVIPVLMALVGMAAFILSNHAHTTRGVAAAAPLLLLSGWGLDRFLSLIRGETKNGLVRTSVLLVMAVFGFWAAQKNFGYCRDWMTNKSSDAMIGQQLDKDWKQYRVIIASHYPQFDTPALTVLCDHKEAYVLNFPNPIYLETGEKGKDVVLLMYGAPGFDKALEDRVHAEFPQAQWSVIESPNPDIHRFMLRAVIPMEALSETPGKLFYVQRVPSGYWRRQFYWKDYAVGRGIVWWDERVPILKAPYPPGMNEYMTGRADGEITAATSGKYYFSINETSDVVELFIDGKKIFHLKADANNGLRAKEGVHLEAGKHHVTYVSTFRRLTNYQDITVTPPDGGKEWVLGQAPEPNK